MKSINKIHLPLAKNRNLKKICPNAQLYETEHLGEFYASELSLHALHLKKIQFELLKSWDAKDVPIEIAYPSQSFIFGAPHTDAILEAFNYTMAQEGEDHQTQLLYMGRQTQLQEGCFILDRPGGKRSYQWMVSKKGKKTEDIRSLFPNLIKQIQNRDTKVILSLGSGGVRLFAHCTLFKLIDTLGLHSYIDEIWGSSGGSIAGLTYSLGVDPNEIEEEGYHLYNERYSLRFSPKRMDVLKNFLVDSVLPDSRQSIQGLLDCQNAMKSLIEKYLNQPRKEKPIPFYCIAYNLKERRSESLTPERLDASLYKSPAFIISTDPMEAILASTAIPIIYVPKKIMRDKVESIYIDGGAMEEVPLISPYRKWVQDRRSGRESRKKLLILSVNLFPHMSESSFFERWIFKRIPAFRLIHLWASYLDLIRYAHIDEQRSFLEHDPNVKVLELTLPLSIHGVVDTKIIPQVIETAQQSFFQQLLKIEQGLADDKKKAASTRSRPAK